MLKRASLSHYYTQLNSKPSIGASLPMLRLPVKRILRKLKSLPVTKALAYFDKVLITTEIELKVRDHFWWSVCDDLKLIWQPGFRLATLESSSGIVI